MHLPTLRADHPAVLSRFFRARRARVPAALVALLAGSAALITGCREDPPADSPAPALAPSAPPGSQSKPTGKCLAAANFAQFLAVPEGFPLCVVGVHAAPGRDGSGDRPFVFDFGEPLWEVAPDHTGPITGAKCTKTAADDPKAPCQTSQDLWSIGTQPRAGASPGAVSLSVEPFPSPSNWTATNRVPLGLLTYSFFSHRSGQADEPGEVVLVATAEEQARASVNALAGIAFPPVPSLERTFYFTGKSALYVNDAPKAAAPGLYRAKCEVDQGTSKTCVSSAIASWTDTPGLVATDVDGNLVATHRSGTLGTEHVAFAAASLDGTSNGTPLGARTAFTTTSIALIGGKGNPSHVVAVTQTGAGIPQPIQLVPVTFEGTNATLGEPIATTMSAGTGVPFADPADPAAASKLEAVTLKVFHDADGDLWMSAQAKPSKPGSQDAVAVFLHLAARTAELRLAATPRRLSTAFTHATTHATKPPRSPRLAPAPATHHAFSRLSPLRRSVPLATNGHEESSPAPPPVAEGQLVLPIPDILRTTETWRVPRERRVFVNRGLKLAEVDWIGFDMDYTLAIYDQPAMDELQIRATLPKLVKRGYPAYLHDVRYDIAFPIRGLFIDKKLGHIVKMDCYKVVQKAYHGLVEIPRDQLRALYQQKQTRLTAARYHWIDTLYALSEVTLYASIVQALEERGIAIDYTQLFNDIRECIDEAHRDGTITTAIEADFPRFLRRDPDLAQALHRWRSAGKKLFVLTNSQRGYTEKMMHFLLDGALPEYPTWRHFFDMVVVAASKPAFFQERRPLLEWEGGATRPFSGHVERGRIYQGGNLIDFERVLGLVGDRVLYVGDHIYGDILRSKKESAWRTAMIIQEMNAEVLALGACADEIVTLHHLDHRRREAEDELRYLQLRFKEISRQVEAYSSGSHGIVTLAVVEAERVRIKRALEQARGALRGLDAEMTELEHRIDKRFHAYWGSLLKEANETSSFGNQVEEYACLYTSKVSNFASYSPLQHWRSPRDVMPHEM